MLVDVQYDQDVFVDGLVKASQKMNHMDIKPKSMTIPQTTFNHFKRTLHYQQMFDNHEDWKRDLWNSRHNPMNFDTPMFMGIRIKVVPDKESQKGICYIHSDTKFGGIKIPFEYSLKLVRQHKIKNNTVILIKSRADDFRGMPKSEWCAINTLREMITEAEFRKYMKYGFILVQGKGGSVYQLFRQRRHIRVWYKGQIIEEICIGIKNTEIPLTDSVIAFKIMVETDESAFRKLGNVYNMKRAA